MWVVEMFEKSEYKRPDVITLKDILILTRGARLHQQCGAKHSPPGDITGKSEGPPIVVAGTAFSFKLR